ncbi:MAG: threonine/serine dehydratase [Acidobacteriota bacterium]
MSRRSVSKPLPVDLPMVLDAARRVRGKVRTTPLASLPSLADRAGCEVFGKLESFQLTGSFKARGALNRMLTLSPEERRGGVWAISAGNHAQGVAWAAAQVGCHATIVMANDSSPLKQAKTRRLGAEVLLHGANYDEADSWAAQQVREAGHTFIHPYEDPLVMAGQGTLVLEMSQVISKLGTLVVPVGGGGLLAGCAVAARALYPGIRVVGVQSDASPAMVRSLEAGRPVETPYTDSIADGLTGRWAGEVACRMIGHLCNGVRLVSEKEIAPAMLWLLNEEGFLIEPAGATPVAALLSGVLDDLPGPLALVLSGGNVHPAVLKQILNQS